MSSYFKEITPLTPLDCFTFFSRHKTDFDFPIHYHEEIELNLILHGKGVKRVVGDHIGTITDAELVLVGSNLPHGWLTHEYSHTPDTEKIYEITIQFHRDLLDDKFLRKNQLFFINSLLERASSGVLFSEETIYKIKDRIISLTTSSGFHSVLEFFSILHDLSISKDSFTLCHETYRTKSTSYKGERLENIFTYMHENYEKDITLKDIADIAKMTEVSFSRYLKKMTGKTFVESLNEIRLGQASRKLIETYLTISEIAFICGYRNVSYFNRLFKDKKGKTPQEFRSEFHKLGNRGFV
jgi:AraC-like DNA-binding protein